MAKKVSIDDLALQALSRCVADPTPRPLHGTKAKPGIFLSSAQSAKDAAQLCLANGWVESTGDFSGKGRSRKELFRVTPSGSKHAIENSEQAELLRDMIAALDDEQRTLRTFAGKLEQLESVLVGQKRAISQLLERVTQPGANSPTLTSQPSGNQASWLNDAVRQVNEHRRKNPHGRCALPDLFRAVGEPNGLSIGAFHDGIRQLAIARRIRLQPYTGPVYQLDGDEYAIVMGKEMKFYAEPVD